MILIPGDNPAQTVQRDGTFTGTVWGQPLLNADSDVAMSTVCFTPGARTYWHVHEKGQLITVVSGQGVVVSRDGTILRVRAGDMVWTEPGVEHWHGAGEGSMLVHNALSIGGTEWHSAVTDDEHREATSTKPE